MDFSADRVVDELLEVPQEEVEVVLKAVVRYAVQYLQMSARMGEMESPGAWALTAEREQDAADLRFVLMTQSEFDAEKQRAKRDRRFANWQQWRNWVERVDCKRRARTAPAEAPRRQTTLLDTLYAERTEILRYGRAMFATVKSRDTALYEVEAEIRRLGGRVEPTDEQREESRSIDARLRQARALKSCRRFVAAEVIRNFMLRKNSSAKTAECEYCFDSFKRNNDDEEQVYCCRTCEKFALRGKWD
jgi:hypothetical protein